MEDYKLKYLKYKSKYLKLKGGTINNETPNDNLDFFLNFNTVKDSYLTRYENFVNKDLIILPITRIGSPSANGFINLITFKNLKNASTFKTVLKTSVELSSDNNYYEYVVGNCINMIKEYVPNFIYTFTFSNLSPGLKKNLSENKIFNNLLLFRAGTDFKNKMNHSELQNYDNIGNGCEKNDRASVLIEYVPNGISIEDLIQEKEFLLDADYNIFCLLFQIYAVLVGLKDIYTHYDLHLGNIMVVKLPKKVKILYKNLKIILYTQYIPVIIDYGRSHINCLKLGTTIFSRVFSEISCENPKCNTLGTKSCDTRLKGLVIERYKDNYSNQSNFYNINLRVKNESFDLRFLHNFMLKFNNTVHIKADYNKRFNLNINREWVDKSDNKSLTYGVEEQLSDYNIRGIIKTTLDALNWLTDYYNINFTSKTSNDLYGIMTINTNLENKEKWSFEKTKVPFAFSDAQNIYNLKF
jgi:hypothetical protein